MKYKLNILLLLAVSTAFFSTTFAAPGASINGKVTDASTGEDLIGATLYIKSLGTGTITNTYGFYSLSVPQGKYQLSVSFLGYQTYIIELKLDTDQSLNIELTPNDTELQEVTVYTERKDHNVSSTEMGVEKMSMKQMETIPVLLGEKDVLKTIQLLPGISSVSEGSSGFSVRGGDVDQNLILLDEAPVYSASHLMGFFSIFNSDALKDMSVYKGGIPANYGGRASSVLDITMKDGNSKNFAASGGIGLISSRLTLEGPIIEDKMSFIISGRRSYADLMGKAINVIDNDMNLYFYDLNAKLNYKMSDKDRIFLSGYFGKDDFGFGDMGTNWGNTTGTLRWNHVFGNKLFSNTTLLYSDYNYGFNMGTDMYMSSGIEDLSLKQDFTFYKNPENTMKFGFNTARHKFNPGELQFDNEGAESTTDIVLDKKQAYESAIYFTNNQKFNARLSADYGVRLSMFNQVGEGWNYGYNTANERIDSTYFDSGEVMQNYFGFEPRLALNYRLTNASSIKASYNRMSQYMHLLSNSTSGQPTDTWVPSTALVKPTIVSQYSVGYFRNFLDDQLEFSVESYYKDMQNVNDYENGADLMLNADVEAQILMGKGRSYGAEFYLKKKYGKLNGWISYTLAKTENKIEGINNNNWYNAGYDKTHDFSIVANYELNKKSSLSAAWVYSTGNAVTFPSGMYQYDGKIVEYYTERNGYRMPDYHRLDLNYHLKGKEHKNFNTSWDFSVYNAYNRKNAYTITFQESETNPGQNEAVKLSLFGIIPSITWNFKF
ncbi:MAG: carboxypeptidase-like regulatory domain-containing protein [Prolixibacteraceae bacterium]